MLIRVVVFALMCGLTLAQSVSNIDQAPAQVDNPCPETQIFRCGGYCWQNEHDEGTKNTSCGKTSLVGSPSRDGSARRFDVSWATYGGQRFHISLANANLEPNATAFTYDTWFYITDLTNVDQLEFDHNQVIANNDTIIYGTQCNLASGIWQYTVNLNGASHWLDSKAKCSRTVFAPNIWHHLVVNYHRDAGVVTYDTVNLDGLLQAFGAVGMSEFTLGWKPTGVLLLNFQINGGINPGSTTAYLDQLTMSWKSRPAPPTNVTAVGK